MDDATISLLAQRLYKILAEETVQDIQETTGEEADNEIIQEDRA